MMAVFFSCISIFGIAAVTATEVYDLAILNGRVMDPKNNLD